MSLARFLLLIPYCPIRNALRHIARRQAVPMYLFTKAVTFPRCVLHSFSGVVQFVCSFHELLSQLSPRNPISLKIVSSTKAAPKRAEQMPFCSWCSRRVGGLSLIAVLFLCYWVLSSEIKTPKDYGRHSGKLSGHSYRNGDGTPRAVGTLTALFAYYSLLIHILVVVFPIRACYAIWDISRSLRRMGRVKKWKEIESLRLSSYSLSSAETLTPSHPYLSSSEAGDFDSGYLADSEVEQNNDIHAILIPNYKEDIQVLRETLDVLACHPQARSQYDVSRNPFRSRFPPKSY